MSPRAFACFLLLCGCVSLCWLAVAVLWNADGLSFEARSSENAAALSATLGVLSCWLALLPAGLALFLRRDGDELRATLASWTAAALPLGALLAGTVAEAPVAVPVALAVLGVPLLLLPRGASLRSRRLIATFALATSASVALAGHAAVPVGVGRVFSAALSFHARHSPHSSADVASFASFAPEFLRAVALVAFVPFATAWGLGCLAAAARHGR